MSSASGGFAPRPNGAPPLDPLLPLLSYRLLFDAQVSLCDISSINTRDLELTAGMTGSVVSELEDTLTRGYSLLHG